MKRALLPVAYSLILVLLTIWLTSEYHARRALHRADFSHKSYWDYWPYWTRTKLCAGDRNPENMQWITWYPNLEDLRLTAGGDNSNYFPSLLPFREIENLKILHLSGVYFESLTEFPYFPKLEEVRFTEAGVRFPPSAEELERLAVALPNIRSFELLKEYEEDGRIIYDATTKAFVFDPPTE